jgi:translocator protein
MALVGPVGALNARFAAAIEARGWQWPLVVTNFVLYVAQLAANGLGGSGAVVKQSVGEASNARPTSITPAG